MLLPFRIPHSPFRIPLIGLVIALLVFGCASSGMQDVQLFDPLPSQPFTKFLVLGIHEDSRVRRLFENAFVAELAAQKVEGVQSYRFIFEEKAINVERVLRAVQEAGADALVTVRAMDVDLQPKVSRPVQREKLEFDIASDNPERRLLPKRDKVTLQTNVYQASSRYMILSATSRVVSPDSVAEVGQEVCRETVKALAKENLIRR